MTARYDLLDAWSRWDSHCEVRAASSRYGRQSDNPAYARALLAAEIGWCAERDLTHVHLRDVLAAWRRAGFSRELALDAVEAGLLAVNA